MSETKGLILVVEDDFNIRRCLGEVFRGEGYTVELAENGQDAMHILRDMPRLPNLIFLDLMMPVMDGQTFLLEIQKNSPDERLRKIPIVVLSAAMNDVEGEVVASLRKPVQLQTLCELAERYAQTSEPD